jgi:hypothetical protein
MSIQQIGSPNAIRLGFGPFELNVAGAFPRKANQVIPWWQSLRHPDCASQRGEVVGKPNDREGMA